MSGPRKSGGGWPAIWYTLRKGREVGFWRLWKAMRSKNSCKTCAVGMGGQAGGMVNEAGHFPEVCKKSLQAMAADMQGAVRSDFWKTYSLPQLQTFSPRELEHSGRLTQPVLLARGEQHYRAVSWEDALERIVKKLKATLPEESFWYFSGRSSNEASFLLQLFARLYGTNHVNNCSYYCHQASGVGLNSSLGTGTATMQLDDLEKTDAVFLIGGNPASNHPRLMRTLMQVRRRGGEVIVINPVIEPGLVNFRVPSDVRSLLFGSKIASLYVQPHIGGDLALLYGIMKRIVELGAVDETFVREHCQDWEALKSKLHAQSWEEIVRKSGVTRDQIETVARRYADAKSAVFAWTMGITHHVNGVQNVQAIANLALMRGMIGKAHSGLLPIRGHSNVQGIGSVGVTPKLKDAIFDRLQNHFCVTLPTHTGLDTLGCIDAAESGKMRLGVCLGGNLYGSNPDATHASAALGKLDLLVYLNTTLNTGHAHGLAAETIILPVLARDEEPQSTTQESMFNYVRLSDGGPARHVGPRSEISVVAEIGERFFGTSGPIPWKELHGAENIRGAMSKVLPGFEELASIGETKKEFYIAGRILHRPQFPTPSGKARLHAHDLPDLSAGEGKLRLMTVRSEGQFNTVVYEDEDLYRGQDRRDVILLHPEDMRRLNLTENQRVTVAGECGWMSNILARAYPSIKAGNALMYYPESNVLVPRTVDPASRTPSFKNVLIEVRG